MNYIVNLFSFAFALTLSTDIHTFSFSFTSDDITKKENISNFAQGTLPVIAGGLAGYGLQWVLVQLGYKSDVNFGLIGTIVAPVAYYATKKAYLKKPISKAEIAGATAALVNSYLYKKHYANRFSAYIKELEEELKEAGYNK